MTTTKRILCLCAFLAFVFVLWFVTRLVIPAYQRDQDNKVKKVRFREVLWLINAIRDFQYSNPERRCPTNLVELMPRLTKEQSAYGVTNLGEALTRFVYFPPPVHESEKAMRERIILVEKLGHYPYQDGVYVVKGDYFAWWKWLGDYTQTLARAGIPFDDLSDQQKVGRR